MALSAKEMKSLKQTAKELRQDIVQTTVWAGGAHIGAALSIVEMLTIIYFKHAHLDSKNPQWEDRDRIVVSKGHAGVGVAPTLAKVGFFDRELLKDFNHFNSPFGMHLDSLKVPGLDASTGSLGHGLAQSVGMAWGSRFLKKDWKTYCILGDGECNEGSVWESAMAAGHFKLNNLIAFVDRNGLMMDGTTEQVMKLEPLPDKFRAFGWNVHVVDGHDFNALNDVIEAAWSQKDRPTMVIANTVKGKGVDFMENEIKWHYGSMDSALADKALASIEASA